MYFSNEVYIFYIFIYIFHCKVFFSKIIFQYKTFFPYENIFYVYNVYFVKKTNIFSNIFFQLSFATNEQP